MTDSDFVTEITFMSNDWIQISDEKSQFDKYFLGSRIFDLSKCILVDREGIIRQHLEHLLTLPYDDRDGLIDSLFASIQYLRQPDDVLIPTNFIFYRILLCTNSFDLLMC